MNEFVWSLAHGLVRSRTCTELSKVSNQERKVYMSLLKQLEVGRAIRLCASLMIALALVLTFNSGQAHAWPWSSTVTVTQVGYVMAGSDFSIVTCDDAWIQYNGNWHQGTVSRLTGGTTASTSCRATFTNVPVNTQVLIDIYATSTGYQAWDGYRTRVKTGLGTSTWRPATGSTITLPNTSFYKY
jgi:hypothetical protein